MRKRKLDYISIGRDYAAGVLSVCEIARRNNCSEAAIRKMAKVNGWERSLTNKVRDAIKLKLVKVDAAEARAASCPLPPEREIIDGASETGVQIIQFHRAGIRQCRAAAETLLAQVNEAMGTRQELEDLIKEETGAKRTNWMFRAVSIPQHAAVVRDLAQALKSLVPLERQAYSLNDVPADPYENLPREEIERRLAELEKRR